MNEVLAGDVSPTNQPADDWALRPALPTALATAGELNALPPSMPPVNPLLRASVMMELTTVGDDPVTISTLGLAANAAVTAWPSAGSVIGTITGGPAVTPS